MVRRVVRMLELPVSLSLGVVRQSASLAGRVVSRLLVSGAASEPPAPPRPAEPPRPRPARRGHGAGSTGSKPARPPRPRAARGGTGTRSEAVEPLAEPPKPPEAAEPFAEPPKPPEPAARPSTPAVAELESHPERPSTGREAAVEEATEREETPRPEEAPRPDETAQPDGPGDPPGPGSSASERELSSAPEPEPIGDVEHEPGAGTSVRAPDPHSPLNTPIGEPDPTGWPDPYDKREDPRDLPAGEGIVFGDEIHPSTGATSTSEPHPGQDPEAEPWEGPKRDRVDR
jgi:hypothetical protein